MNVCVYVCINYMCVCVCEPLPLPCNLKLHRKASTVTDLAPQIAAIQEELENDFKDRLGNCT